MVAHARDGRRAGDPGADLPRAGRARSRRWPSTFGEHKDEFYALSFRTGATQRDSMVDIDGGFGTLFGFASKGVRELPNDTVVLDGGLEQLGRGGTFVGQHVYTSRPGVAVQINAFNFPVWGMLEKLAPAFLAGLPSIVKPASQTAYLTEAVVRRIVESGILPEGSLQLLVRQPARPARRARPCRTRSRSPAPPHTAGLLRNHPSVLHGGVQLGVEADSLNCSILGPDVTPDDPEFDLFVKGVVTEMTVKAGQKCTAIRRAIVPADMADTVVEALDRPAGEGHGRQPRRTPTSGWARWRASTSARRSARRSRRCAPRADLVHGDPDHVDLVDGDAERGAFLGPVLLRARRGAVEPHDVEPFGPVSTVLAYDSVDEAVALAARGKGSPGRLASSPTTPPSPGPSCLGLAPWHGRVLVLDRDDAAESTGHGSPLPMLVHGGPGRAGGGEELGGIRAVLAPHAAHRDPGLARHDDRDHRPLDDRLAASRRRRAPVPQEPRRAADRRHHRLGAAHRSRSRTSTTSPSSPATPSTPTPTRRRRPPTRCSAASSRTATSSCRWPPGCSSTPTRARCWPTSASTTSGSSPRSRPTTRSR